MNKCSYILIFSFFIALPTSAESFKDYPCTQNCTTKQDTAQEPDTFDPNAIEPAAGAEQAIDPSTAEDPFALKPFEQDPFAPETLPGIND